MVPRMPLSARLVSGEIGLNSAIYSSQLTTERIAEWAAPFPQAKPDPSQLPQEWVDALNTAIQAGKIPNIPPSTPTGGNPTYGNLDPMSDEVCSTTYKCMKNNDTWNAPDGVFGASFDDGPLPVSHQTLLSGATS